MQDYENTTEDRGRHKQDDCGALAAEPPKKDNICKINKDELIKASWSLYISKDLGIMLGELYKRK